MMPHKFNVLTIEESLYAIKVHEQSFTNSKDGNEWQICYSNVRIHYSNVFKYSDREIQLGETLE